MTDESHPIIDLTIVIGGKPRRFAVEDFPKGPEMHGTRGSISRISMRAHESGAEFGIHVTNSGIERLWKTVSSCTYEVMRDIKSET